MDRKSWFIDFARKNGRKRLYPYAIGIIKNIMSCSYCDAEERENDIRNALKSLDESLNDDSLPWDHTNTKKPSAPTEDRKETLQLNYTIDCE